MCETEPKPLGGCATHVLQRAIKVFLVPARGECKRPSLGAQGVVLRNPGTIFDRE